jgi:hypothetical protein
VKATVAVKSPGLLVTVTEPVELGSELLAENMPFAHGVVWLAPLTAMTPTSASMLFIHETVAVWRPEGGLARQKINVRSEATVPVSVPGISVAVTPPKLALILAALFASMATMIIAARFVPLPMFNAGVVTVVTPH